MNAGFMGREGDFQLLNSVQVVSTSVMSGEFRGVRCDLNILAREALKRLAKAHLGIFTALILYFIIKYR
jgi:hypothetical protein